jgi:hypothetical protein
MSLSGNLMRSDTLECKHESRGADWLPMHNGVIKQHPYCGNCGTVKNISSDKGKSIGSFTNSLSKMKKELGKKRYKISDAQIRLIIKELSEMDGFTDTYWMTFSRQREIFVSAVKKYIKISRQTIESFV